MYRRPTGRTSGRRTSPRTTGTFRGERVGGEFTAARRGKFKCARYPDASHTGPPEMHKEMPAGSPRSWNHDRKPHRGRNDGRVPGVPLAAPAAPDQLRRRRPTDEEWEAESGSGVLVSAGGTPSPPPSTPSTARRSARSGAHPPSSCGGAASAARGSYTFARRAGTTPSTWAAWRSRTTVRAAGVGAAQQRPHRGRHGAGRRLPGSPHHPRADDPGNEPTLSATVTAQMWSRK